MRLATNKDLQAVFELTLSCIKKMRSNGIDQWDDVYPNLEHLKVDEKVESLYVHELENRIVACAVLNEFQDPEYKDATWSLFDGKIVTVHRVMVDPAMQGRGIAIQVMKFIENIAKNKGYEIIRLDAFFENPSAVRLYERLGYQFAGHIQMRKGKFVCFEKRI